MPIERKLAAIMFTDIAGYTESMSKSESKSLDTLEKKRSILKPLLKEYKGTFVKEIGDGTLSYFESAVNAATCAVKLQETTYDDKDMNIRAGIHIGDIVFKDGDVFGGGVNVASRLESIAPAGGVCVSKSVYDELSNQDDFDGIELGLQSLKGVGRLVEVFGLKGDKLNEPKPSEYQANKIDKHSDDEVPSIAIIPLKNKGDDKDIFYAYGISADIITDCSSAGLIRVESLDNIEKIEDWDKLKADELADELSVRYITTGSLWKMDNMFQLSVELYDTKDKKVVWSDRWQEEWDNLPTIKMNLSDGLLKALDTKQKYVNTSLANNTASYKLYLEAKNIYNNRKSIDDINRVIESLTESISIDNLFYESKLFLSEVYKDLGELEKAIEIINKLIQDSEKSHNEISLARCYYELGDIYKQQIKSELAIKLLKQAQAIYIKINDIMFNMYCNQAIGAILHDIGKYTESLKYMKECVKTCKQLGNKEHLYYPYYLIGSIYNKLGNCDEALNYHKNSIKLIYNDTENDIFWKKSIQYQMGKTYLDMGLYDEALEHFNTYYEASVKRNYKRMISASLWGKSDAYIRMGDYNKSLQCSEEALNVTEDNGLKEDLIELYIINNLSKKRLSLDFSNTKLMDILKSKHLLIFVYNFRLYELLEDTSYLETAYNQVQEKADKLEPDVAAKFLSYPIPKAIVEEWEKVK